MGIYLSPLFFVYILMLKAKDSGCFVATLFGAEGTTPRAAGKAMAMVNMTMHTKQRPGLESFFKDVQKPAITITSPEGGVTSNENIAITGLVQDNGTLDSVTWLRGEQDQGVLELTEDKFDLKGIVLLKGDNSYSVVAIDSEGNQTVETVNVAWEPLRTLELVDAPERQEGKRINIPLKLASNGDVGGMTFILNYDHQVLKDPILVWSSAAGTSINSVNTDVPGEVKATFSLVGSGLPEGNQLIATVSFRVRSVPATMYTDYSLEVLDMSMTDGSQVNFGTYVDPGTARLLRRKYNGDSNGNDRLDIGDGTLVQRLANAAVRAGEEGGNLADSLAMVGKQMEKSYKLT